MASQEDTHNPLYDHTGNRPNGYYLLLTPNKTIPFPNVKRKSNHLLKFIFLFIID